MGAKSAWDKHLRDLADLPDDPIEASEERDIFGGGGGGGAAKIFTVAEDTENGGEYSCSPGGVVVENFEERGDGTHALEVGTELLCWKVGGAWVGITRFAKLKPGAAIVAHEQQVACEENGSVTITLTGYDVAGPLSGYEIDDDDTLWDAVDNEDWTVTYTPAGGWEGTDTFLFRVTGPSDTSDWATITIIVGGG